jgi:DNA-binding winged helix-turn-helix (wHTH) protein/formylglycine-generating enzyme required for sulfatase activity/dienelactone hydrolase
VEHIPATQRTVTFGPFTLDPHGRELRKGGRRIRLAGQPFRVVELLLEKHGDVVTRDEMRQRLWPDDTFVDFDHGLNNAISRLREVLRDDAEHPRYIETISRLGYRLVCPVQQPNHATEQATPVTTHVTAASLETAAPILQSTAPRIAGSVYFFGSAAAIVAAGIVVWTSGIFGTHKDETWIRAEAIPKIRQLVDQGDFIAAYLLELEADRVHPGDRVVAQTWDGFTRPVTITSDPPGAEVYWRDSRGQIDWHRLGTTPLEKVRFPIGGTYRLRFEKVGYRPYEALATLGWLRANGRFPLDPVGTIADEVSHVPGGTFGLESPGLEDQTPITLPDFLIDRFEVTNRRYKAFVDAGGYATAQYWRHPFVKDGRTLTWEQAMRQFMDETARPGPVTWELSTYPNGQDEEPVHGVSWYEAAAYAAFEGRDLPTIYHWNRAAGTAAASSIAVASNFSDKGPSRVGQFTAMSRFDARDMAGNVREWCFNEGLGGTGGRFILGGGWNDASYMFTDLYTQSPWDRSLTNGFRLVTYLGVDKLERAKQPIKRPTRDFRKERPVGDAEFNIYLRMYRYDRQPLNAVIEHTDVTEDWIRQRVSFDAAYGQERAAAYLFLPRRAKPPYQPVVYFPGSSVIYEHSIDEEFSHAWNFVVKGGRALMFPVYRGTLDRRTELNSDLPDETVAYRDYMVQWVKDLGRSIDYLETRDDIAANQLGYYGFSWGARLGGLILAVEPRLKAAVLQVAGLKFQRALPEADPFNFIPHVTVPVLMLNGRYDEFFPLGTSQLPMFERLGTPAADKRHVLYDSGHLVPRPQLSKEAHDWFDRYLGPIRNIAEAEHAR